MRDLIRRGRRSLVAAVLLLAVVLAGFAGVVVHAQNQSREGLENRFRLRTALASRFVESYVADVLRQERVVAQASFADRRVSARKFREVVEQLGFSTASITDSRGRLIHMHPVRRDLAGQNMTPRYPYLAQALNGRAGVSDIVTSMRGTRIVAFSTPYESTVGRRVFSGAFLLDESALADYLRNAVPLAVGAAHVLDSKGVIITGTRARVPRTDHTFVVERRVRGTGWKVELAAPKALLFAPISGLSRWVPWMLFAGFAVTAVGILMLFLRLIESRAALATKNQQVTRLMGTQQRFIAMTSHELRTPLTSVTGYLDLLLKGTAGRFTEEQSKLLEVVRRNAGRLLDLVADLMLVAQIDAGRLELNRKPLALDDLVRESVENALPQAREKRVELTLAAERTPAVLADRNRLGQVIGNLVSNAVKFTPEDGRVEVRAFRENGYAVIEVEDNGMGIPEVERKRLFDRFYRASGALAQEIPGTGLGLSIARQLTELHGGKLAFTSEEGVGTTFRVELPTSR